MSPRQEHKAGNRVNLVLGLYVLPFWVFCSFRREEESIVFVVVPYVKEAAMY